MDEPCFVACPRCQAEIDVPTGATEAQCRSCGEPVSDTSRGQIPACVLRFPFRLEGQKPLDFIGCPGVAARRVNKQPKIGGIDHLEPEKIKGQFSDERMMHRFPSFCNIEHIVTGP